MTKNKNITIKLQPKKIGPRPQNNRGGPKKKKQNSNKPQRHNKVTPVGRAMRAIGSLAGNAIGLPGVGQMAAAGISRVFGQGDYSVKQNSMMSGAPSFAALNQGIKIRHREYIGDVTSSILFNNTTYAIQPTNQITFPWLSQIAGSFEQYKFLGLIFTFNTTAGNAISSTNNALGVAGMVTCYDPSAQAFVSKRQCEDYVGCTSSVPSVSIMHPVECKPKSDVLERYYTLQSALADVEDLKFYNMGTLNLFTVGSQTATTIGELWVSYDIELFNPRIEVSGADSIADHIFASGVAATNTLPFGSGTIAARTGSNLGSSMVNSVLTIPANSARGVYYFSVFYNGTGVVGGSTLTPVFSSNTATYNMLLNGSAFSSSTAVTNNLSYDLTFIKTNNGAATITFTGTTLAGTSQFDIFLVPLPPNLVTKSREVMNSLNEKVRLRPVMLDLIKEIQEDFENQRKPRTLDKVAERGNSREASKSKDKTRNELIELVNFMKKADQSYDQLSD